MTQSTTAQREQARGNGVAQAGQFGHQAHSAPGAFDNTWWGQDEELGDAVAVASIDVSPRVGDIAVGAWNGAVAVALSGSTRRPGTIAGPSSPGLRKTARSMASAMTVNPRAPPANPCWPS